MRERAGAATPGRWREMHLGSEGCIVLNDGRLRERKRVAMFGYKEWKADHADAEYVASMQPAVALAVAGWLEEFAAWFEREVAWDTPEGPCCAEPAACGGHDSCWYHQECDGVVPGDCHCFDKALAVARAYLGSKEPGRG